MVLIGCVTPYQRSKMSAAADSATDTAEFRLSWHMFRRSGVLAVPDPSTLNIHDLS
jgi:hypothetical protein